MLEWIQCSFSFHICQKVAAQIEVFHSILIHVATINQYQFCNERLLCSGYILEYRHYLPCGKLILEQSSTKYNLMENWSIPTLGTQVKIYLDCSYPFWRWCTSDWNNESTWEWLLLRGISMLCGAGSQRFNEYTALHLDFVLFLFIFHKIN